MIWRVIPDNPARRTKSRPGVGKVKGSIPRTRHTSGRNDLHRLFLGNQDLAYERGRDEAAARGLAAVGKLTEIVEVENETWQGAKFGVC